MFYTISSLDWGHSQYAMAASIRKPPVYCLSLSLSPCMVSAWLRHASLTQAACLCTLLVLLAIACIVCMPLYTCICQGFHGSVSELTGIVHASAAKLRLDAEQATHASCANWCQDSRQGSGCKLYGIISRPQLRRDYPLNLSISLSGGKENNNDSPSKGD